MATSIWGSYVFLCVESMVRQLLFVLHRGDKGQFLN